MTGFHPKVSIVTASYNQAKFIEEAINSVVSQNYPNFEHIIFDNCSTDGTIDILKKYPHLVWVSEPDKCQSDALNKGFKKATGEFIGWLNADDLYLPSCFNSVIETFTGHPESDIVFGDYRWVDQKGDLIKVRRETDFDLFIYKYLHVPCFGSTATFFRRNIFKENNFINLNYDYAMDYELLLRLALKGHRFSHSRKVLADFRWHSECKSALNRKKQIIEKEKALFSLDNDIQKIYLPIRPAIRAVLMLMARAKRTLLKIVNALKLFNENRNSRIIVPLGGLFPWRVYFYFSKVLTRLRAWYFKVTYKSRPPRNGISVGLIGCGNFARYAYLPAFNNKQMPAVISGLFSNNPESCERVSKLLRYRTEAFISYEELLDSGIKGVILTLPNHLHYQYIVKALESGIDVFCEKPVANNLEDALAIRECLKKRKNILMVGFNQRYTDRVEKVKSLIERKELGEIYEVNAFHNQNIAAHLKQSNWLNDAKKSGGGILYNAGIHLVNLMLYLFGPIDAVSARLECRKLPEDFGEDTADCDFHFKSGTKAKLLASYINQVNSSYEHVIIKGSKGSVFTDLKTSRIMYKPAHESKWRNICCKNESISDSVFNELSYFCNCVEKRVKPDTDIVDSINTLSVIKAAYLSGLKKRRVCVSI